MFATQTPHPNPLPAWAGRESLPPAVLIIARSVSPARNEGATAYSKLVAAPDLEASHLSKASWLSTINRPPAIAE